MKFFAIGSQQPTRRHIIRNCLIENATKALDISLELEDWFTLLVECQGHKVP